MKKIKFFILSLLSGIFVHSQTVSTITAGSFTDGLGIDGYGNVYCSAWGGNTVYKLDTLGNVTVFKNGFSNPNGIAVNDSNQIFICDHTADTIFKYDTAGNLLAAYGGFVTPAGIKKIPGTNDFYVVEYNTNKLKRLDANGTVTQLHSGNPLNGPAGMAFIGDTLYIANFNNRNILKFIGSSVFNLTAQIPSFPGPANFVGFLSSLNGKLYATQIQGNRIYEIDPGNNNAMRVYAGSISGGANGALNTATFNSPNGILGDPVRNRLYVSDAGSQNLRIIDLNVTVSLNKNHNSDYHFSISPNPAQSQLTLDVPKKDGAVIEVSILNISGLTLLTDSLQVVQGKIKLDLSNLQLSSGSYFIVLKDRNSVATELFIFK